MFRNPHSTPGALTGRVVFEVANELYWLAHEIQRTTRCGWHEAQAEAVDLLLKLTADIEEDVRYRPVEAHDA